MDLEGGLISCNDFPVGANTLAIGATTPTYPGGTYTVGATGNYTTLTAAVADLTGKLITGPIT